MSSGQPGPAESRAPPTGNTPTPGGLGTPPGLQPGFDPALLPHENKGAELKATVWTVLALATVFFALRIYCRLLKNRRLLYEDWVLFLSYLCLTVDAILIQIETGLGYGMHFYDIPVENANTMALYGLISLSFGVMGQVWSKTSFAMTLLRITGPKTKIFVWFLIITINVFMTLGRSRLAWKKISLNVLILPWLTQTLFFFFPFRKAPSSFGSSAPRFPKPGRR